MNCKRVSSPRPARPRLSPPEPGARHQSLTEGDPAGNAGRGRKEEQNSVTLKMTVKD